MPRGYRKKHARVFGKKASRGGSSKNALPRWYCWDRDMSGHRMNALKEVEAEDIYDLYGDAASEHNSLSDDETIRHDESYFLDDDSNAASWTNGEEASYSFCDGDDDSSSFLLIGGYNSMRSGQESIADKEIEGYLCVQVGTEDSDSFSFASSPPLAIESIPDTRDDATSRYCTICLEERPLLQLMNACHRHPLACRDCLRTLYIIKPQKEAASRLSKIYPLRCFWPTCSRILHDTQVKQLIEDRHEMEGHYFRQRRAKDMRKQELNRAFQVYRWLACCERVYECPHCNSCMTVQPYKDCIGEQSKDLPYKETNDRQELKCNSCSKPFGINRVPVKDMLAIYAALGEDFANCPSCGAFVVRSGGCYHMTCICGENFHYKTGKKIHVGANNIL